MAIPETDPDRLMLWCHGRVPAPAGDGVGEHTRSPIARLRYKAATGVWRLAAEVHRAEPRNGDTANADPALVLRSHPMPRPGRHRPQVTPGLSTPSLPRSSLPRPKGLEGLERDATSAARWVFCTAGWIRVGSTDVA